MRRRKARVLRRRRRRSGGFSFRRSPQGLAALFAERAVGRGLSAGEIGREVGARVVGALIADGDVAEFALGGGGRVGLLDGGFVGGPGVGEITFAAAGAIGLAAKIVEHAQVF